MAILNELTVVGNARVAGNVNAGGSITVSQSGSVVPGDSRVVNGNAVASALINGEGSTMSITTSNYYATILTAVINTAGVSNISGGFTLYATCDKTTSTDAGNTKYTGGNGIIYVKYYGTSSAITVVPEWFDRNGCRNGDCAAGGYIDANGRVNITVGFRCGKDMGTTTWSAKLLYNNSVYAMANTWTTGSSAGTKKGSYIGDSTYHRIEGITSGKVLLSKWAGEDCSLETGGHALDWKDDGITLYNLGFSTSAAEGSWNNLNNIILFPEHQSKYTVYTKNALSATGWPLDTGAAGRCTISKVSCMSETRADARDAYWIEQEAEMITAQNINNADQSYILTFKRSGYVTGASEGTTSGSVTWGAWRALQTFTAMKAYNGGNGIVEPTSQSAATSQVAETYTVWNIPYSITIGYSWAGAYYDTAEFKFPALGYNQLNCIREFKFQIYVSNKARIKFTCGSSSVVFGDWPSSETVPSNVTCSNSNVTGTYVGTAFFNSSGSLNISWTHKSNYQKCGCVVLS